MNTSRVYKPGSHSRRGALGGRPVSPCYNECKWGKSPAQVRLGRAHNKDLSTVERAFRSLKSVDLKVRPLHHRRSRALM